MHTIYNAERLVYCHILVLLVPGLPDLLLLIALFLSHCCFARDAVLQGTITLDPLMHAQQGFMVISPSSNQSTNIMASLTYK